MVETRQQHDLKIGGTNGKDTSTPAASHGTMPLSRLLRRLQTLHLYRNVLEDEVGRSFVALLEHLADETTPAARTVLLSAYAKLFSLLAKDVDVRKGVPAGDPWQNHLLDRILGDDNPFTVKAQRVPLSRMGASLVKAACHDLKLLHSMYTLDGTAILALLEERIGEDAGGLIPWDALVSTPDSPPPATLPIKARMAAEADWDHLIEALVQHYGSAGTGVFARYRAFRWTRHDGTGRLEGISHPDPINLDELVEYDLERDLLLQNTEQFVEGFAANNVLLYGDRGTGKSSTVKALLHRYGDRGLRLVEVSKSLLGDFPRILALLRGRRERFIVFVDDLSFDEKETAYKEMKAALEGSVESRPENVVVYATSNRRHMVQEQHSDRFSGDGELRQWDSHQEKLSLADRFGITIVFTSPDQSRYLRIVNSLVDQRGLEVDRDDLRMKALRWATQQGGFSGRAARQFVDHLAGEIGLAASK